MSQHNARIYGDTTECSKCGKQWDTNDPYPPECTTEVKPPYSLQRWLKDNSLFPNPRKQMNGETFINTKVVEVKMLEMQKEIDDYKHHCEQLERELLK